MADQNSQAGASFHLDYFPATNPAEVNLLSKLYAKTNQ
jgi:hypothetical protein